MLRQKCFWSFPEQPRTWKVKLVVLKASGFKFLLNVPSRSSRSWERNKKNLQESKSNRTKSNWWFSEMRLPPIFSSIFPGFSIALHHQKTRSAIEILPGSLRRAGGQRGHEQLMGSTQKGPWGVAQKPSLGGFGWENPIEKNGWFHGWVHGCFHGWVHGW